MCDGASKGTETCRFDSHGRARSFIREACILEGTTLTVRVERSRLSMIVEMVIEVV